MKFPANIDVPPVHWNIVEINDIVNIINYLLDFESKESFKFYYLPDLTFVKNGSNIEASLRGQRVDIKDFFEINTFIQK